MIIGEMQIHRLGNASRKFAIIQMCGGIALTNHELNVLLFKNENKKNSEKHKKNAFRILSHKGTFLSKEKTNEEENKKNSDFKSTNNFQQVHKRARQ